MNRIHLPVLILTLSALNALHAETRSWKSADGIRSIQGEFLTRDAASVTIRNQAGKEITITFPKLHPDDIKWLEANHSLTSPPPASDSPPAVAPPKDPTAFYDNLTFRDTRESTLSKLKSSDLVEMATAETFIGRLGLNGIFRTREKVGGLDNFLYFDWTQAGTLCELSIQTELLPSSDYKSALEPCWKELIEVLIARYGKPLQKGSLPAITSIPDGSFLPSHLWNLETGGSARLGAARDGQKYQLVVRFSEKKIQPVAIP